MYNQSDSCNCIRVTRRQLQRQSVLQPRLVLPAGRIISIEEGRRLANLIRDDEERVFNEQRMLIDSNDDQIDKSSKINGSRSKTDASNNPVFVEDSVAKRILMMRHEQNSESNIKASMAYLKRNRSYNNNSILNTDPTISSVASEIFHPSSKQRKHAGRTRRRDRAMHKNKNNFSEHEATSYGENSNLSVFNH